MRYGLTALIFIMVALQSCTEEGAIIESPWKYNNPHDKLVDERRLLELNQEIQEGKFGEINSLLILRDSEVIFENYYNGTKRKDLQPLNGATLSVMNIIAGIAIESSPDLSLDSRAIDLFSDQPEHFTDIPQKDKISIRHLMNHTSGIWWDEANHGFFDDENDAHIMLQQDDILDFVLSKPMIQVPGNNYSYNSGNAILLGGMIERAFDIPFNDYVEHNLFEPLDIQNWEWTRDKEGNTNTAFGLKLTTQDMARIGYLYLNRGSWEGDSLMSKNWVRQSTRPNINAGFLYNYGRYWWSITHVNFLSQILNTNDMFFAWGEGGQYIFVIPHLDMVVVSTASNYDEDLELSAFQILSQYILPSSAEPTSGGI